MVPGGAVNERAADVFGGAGTAPGDEYVLFLWTSKSGADQVIGLTQGLFSLAGGRTPTRWPRARPAAN